jgi:BAG domain
MPPAYETYLDTPSYIPGETEEGCNHLMFKSAARTIQKYLEHWTERAGYGEARNRFDVYGALSKSINSPKTHDRDFDKTHKDPRPREEPSAGSTSHQAHTRKSFLSRSGSGPKPCLHRKKSVTWDPTLDKKHGAQEPKMLSSHEWCESFIEDQSSYWNGIPEAGERDPNNVKALNAIEFVLSNVRQWCLDLMDPRCDLDSGYSHVKKYSRLVEMLMSDVLEKLDSLCIDSNDLGNRQTRKRFANETNELLRQMDLFMQEFRGHAPNQSRKKDSRDPDTTPNSPDLPGDEHGFVYSRAHISPNAICLGKIQVWLTKEELATGGRRTVHFEAEIQNPITGAPQHAMLKMPIYIKPGSKPGTKIDAGHAWCQDSRSRTPGGY